MYTNSILMYTISVAREKVSAIAETILWNNATFTIGFIHHRWSGTWSLV